MSYVSVDLLTERNIKIIEMARDGESIRIIAANLGIGKTQVQRVIEAAKSAGKYETVAEFPIRKRKNTGQAVDRKTRSQPESSPVIKIDLNTIEMSPLERFQALRQIQDALIYRLKSSFSGETVGLPFKAKEIKDIIDSMNYLNENFDVLVTEIEIEVSQRLASKLRHLPAEIQTMVAEALRV